MALFQLIPSFNAGELSPYLDGRSDLDKYASGCRLLENFIILPYGGIYRRPGTEYLGIAKFPNKLCRLIGFNFSTNTSFVIEAGELYLRFWSNGLQVPNPAMPTNPLEVVTPYLEAELREVQYIQINDVMYFVHPLHPPYKLTRRADDDWTFAEVVWDWPALLDENVTATTITPSATSGNGITLTASAALFDAGHVGSFWQLAHTREKAFVEQALTANGTSASLTALGNWEITTYGVWAATLELQRSTDNGTTWETIRSYKSSSDRNVSSSGKEAVECLLRLKVVDYSGSSGSVSPRALLELGEAKDFGIVKITAVTDSTHATANVINSLFATTATNHWSEGAWSTKRGFPRTVALYQQRLHFAGTMARPQSIWGSIINDFENFQLSVNDDSGLFFTLSAQESNPIQWMIAQTKLLIGTAGGEWTLGSDSTDAAITPTNVQAFQQSGHGSKYMRALIVGDVALFAQRQGLKVRELVFDYTKQGWVAQDLTLLAEHVTAGQILECAYQQQPDSIYWTVTGKGQLVGMTYERLQNVVGWHRHRTGVRIEGGVEVQDDFESVATIYGGEGPDEVWMSVRRKVNGQDVRTIERFRPDFRSRFEASDKKNWWYLDCAKRQTYGGSGSALVENLGHLEGRTVDILADGAVSPARTVSAGAITLQEPGKVVLAGLPFVSLFRPMKLETQLRDGASRGKTKRISKLVVALYKSLGGEFSSDGNQWNWLYSRAMHDPMDSSPPVYTGDKEVSVGGNYNSSADITLRQTQPLPLTILAIVAKWSADGD